MVICMYVYKYTLGLYAPTFNLDFDPLQEVLDGKALDI